MTPCAYTLYPLMCRIWISTSWAVLFPGLRHWCSFGAYKGRSQTSFWAFNMSPPCSGFILRDCLGLHPAVCGLPVRGCIWRSPLAGARRVAVSLGLCIPVFAGWPATSPLSLCLNQRPFTASPKQAKRESYLFSLKVESPVAVGQRPGRMACATF